ncbi:MAG TPA: RIP metalloprotease RseP, partial [Candidatus Hypogeohydataceae bacterium YC38]
VKDLLLESQEKVVPLQIKRGQETKVLELSLDSPGAKESFLEGIFPTLGLRVDHVVEGFPAERIGLRPGDQILSLNGESLRVWEALLRIMATSEGKEMTLQWQRGSETFSERFRPMKDEKNAFGRLGMKLKEKSIVKQYGFLGSCRAGTYKALVMIKRIYLTVRGLFTQKVSSETVGGIILIAQASYESAKLGLGKLLYFIGILSLQLAILNILPIPVLDGGHLLFLGIEKAKGSPVSERTMAIAQYIGLALILCLVVYSTRNDILRLLMRQ